MRFDALSSVGTDNASTSLLNGNGTILVHSIIRVFRWQQRLEGSFLALCVAVIAALTIANVLGRALLGISWAIVEEVVQMLMIAICFIGMSYGAGMARHIRMSAIHDALPLPWRRRLMTVTTALTAVLMVGLCYYACRYVATVYQLGGIFPATRIPYFAVYLLAPIGFALTAAQMVGTAWLNWMGDEVFLSALVREQDANDSPPDENLIDAHTATTERPSAGSSERKES